MTIREKLENMLEEHGMFPSQATEVMDIAIPQLNKIVDDYSINFNQPEDSYPEPIYTVLFLALKPIALEWIETNKPMAWYKPMFV